MNTQCWHFKAEHFLFLSSSSSASNVQKPGHRHLFPLHASRLHFISFLVTVSEPIFKAGANLSIYLHRRAKQPGIMSQDSYTILTSARYQGNASQAEETQSSSANTRFQTTIMETSQDQVNAESSETPMRRSSSTKSSKRIFSFPSRVSTPKSFSSRGSGICLTPDDIESINGKLAQARREGEMPTTTISPIHTDAILEDYGYLLRLREARGDVSQPPSPAYNELRVDVAKKIKDRDSSFDDEEAKREAVRRVENFVENIKNVEKKRLFCDVNSPKTPSTKSSVDVESFSEELLSIVEHAADQTLVDATKPLLKTLGKQNKAYSHHVEHLVSAMGTQQDLQTHLHSTMQTQQRIHERIHLTLETQQDLQERLHHSVTNQQHLQDHFVTSQQHLQDHFVNSQQHLQSSMTGNLQSVEHHLDSINNLASTLNALMVPQAQATQASTENLTLITGIVAHLSQQLNTLPVLIQQTVHNAVRQEVYAAVHQVMQAQQEAMLSLLEERRTRPETPKSTQCSTSSSTSRRSRCITRVKSLFRQRVC